MTEEAIAAGWIVQMIVPGTKTAGSAWRGHPLEDAPTFQYFNVAVGLADKAVEAARKKAGATDEAPMRAIRRLSPFEVEIIGLRLGEARPA